MRLASAVLVLALVQIGSPHFVTRAVADSPFKINEIMAGPARDWDGSGAFSSRDDEWVELVNTGAGSLDLAGYYLTDGDSIPRFAFTGTLAPGGFRLVFGKESYDWEKATGHPAFGLSLANSGDAVMLWQIVGAESLLVDSYRFKSHEAAADRAVGRIPDGTGLWTLFDSLDPYTGTLTPPGTGCAPTPGATNVCDTTPTTTTSWGRLKAIYR